MPGGARVSTGRRRTASPGNRIAPGEVSFKHRAVMRSARLLHGVRFARWSETRALGRRAVAVGGVPKAQGAASFPDRRLGRETKARELS